LSVLTEDTTWEDICLDSRAKGQRLVEDYGDRSIVYTANGDAPMYDK